jgi:hypothetical protein
MKHIHTFESFVNENLNEAAAFKEGDFVKVFTTNTGNQISYGVVKKMRGQKFDLQVFATGNKDQDQPDRGLAVGLGGPVVWKPGITAEDLRKALDDVDSTSNYGEGFSVKKAVLWNPGK